MLGSVEPLHYTWGEAAERPGEVRRRLRQRLEDLSKGIGGMISAVQRNCVADPEFSFLAEQEIEKELKASEAMDRSIQYWRMLASIYRNCERKVPKEVVELGRGLLAGLHHAEASTRGIEAISTISSHTESLESEVWAVWVWTDPDEAMQYLEVIAAPRKQARLMMAALSSILAY